MSIDIANLLDMAAGASGTLGNVVSAFKGLTERAKAGEQMVGTAGEIIDLSAGLAQAQVKLTLLETELMKLQRDLEADDRVQQRKRNYAKAETPTGELVYRLKEHAETEEPPHYVCPACFERDQIRTLQPRGTILECDECKARYGAKKDGGARIAPVRRGRFDGAL